MILRELEIYDFALIDRATLSFKTGLTVLTGETGAGKSVVVNALALVLGGRADKENIRHGRDSTSISATFENPQVQQGKALFDTASIEVDRKIKKSGSSSININGRKSSVSQLRELTSPWIQIVSQHSGQLLMNEDNHLDFFDHLANLTVERETVAKLYENWSQASDELRRVSTKRKQLADERELLLFQKGEIEKAEIRAGEEEELMAERKRLDSVQSLMASASMIQNILSSDVDASGANSVLDMISSARRELDNMAEIDNALSKEVESLTEIDFQMEELRRSIESYGESLQDDPVRLEEVNFRLDEIYKLKKKYGGSEGSILATLEDIKKRLQKRPDIDGLIGSLAAEENKRRMAYADKAIKLSSARRKATQDIDRLVELELAELAIDNARFKCELVFENDENGIVIDGRTLKPATYGLETVHFMFSANPGESLKPLVKTASGGEMSRVLLALKSIELVKAKVKENVLVFDEVDVGIGGQTAVEVGRKLKRLSRNCQVIVITHLHQIARKADHHFLAEKSVVDANTNGLERTSIAIRELNQVGVKREINRMVALPEEEVKL
ncbi:MAG: DNA repair protein RecN [candidate division Zixibacteria bacterium]|nr:DNA repair protein RecN [candidate division Zixibacteria bacterium]